MSAEHLSATSDMKTHTSIWFQEVNRIYPGNTPIAYIFKEIQNDHLCALQPKYNCCTSVGNKILRFIFAWFYFLKCALWEVGVQGFQ